MGDDALPPTLGMKRSVNRAELLRKGGAMRIAKIVRAIALSTVLLGAFVFLSAQDDPNEIVVLGPCGATSEPFRLANVPA